MTSVEVVSQAELEASRICEEMSRLDPSSKEYEIASERYVALLEILNKYDQAEIAQNEATERMRIEEEKINSNAQVERMKAGLTPGKACLEVFTRGVVPVITAVIGFVGYSVLQSRTFDHENGNIIRYNSTKALHTEDLLHKK